MCRLAESWFVHGRCLCPYMHAPAKLRHIQSMLARYDNNSWLYYRYVESGNYTQACYDKKVEEKDVNQLGNKYVKA